MTAASRRIEVALEPAEVYQWLVGRSDRAGCDGFDAHVVASILAIAIAEAAAADTPVVAGLGLAAAEVVALASALFPHAGSYLAAVVRPAPIVLGDDEACLRDLLERHATSGTPFEARLAALVARRAQRPNHLWQDLGLRNRNELSWLMARHFEVLAARNSRDMKWKKFLYRTICRDEGYLICTAPSCAECCDFERCFGDESGESRLAAVRRAVDRDERQG